MSISPKNTKLKITGARRVTPDHIIDQKTCLISILPFIKQFGHLYHKYTTVIAREVKKEEDVITITSAGYETKNTAKPGDFIVTNSTKAKEQYIVPGKNFHKLYNKITVLKNGSAKYHATGSVYAIQVTKATIKKLKLPRQFDIIASWGEVQIVRVDDFLACPIDVTEVYCIANIEFKETYKKTD